MGIAMAVATFISGPTVVAAAQLSRPHVRIGRLVMATEILAIAFASLVSGTGYHLAVFGSTGDPMVFAGVAALTAAVAVPMMRARGLYSAGLSDRFDLQLRSVLGAWLLALMFVAVLTFALKLGVAYRAGRAHGTTNLIMGVGAPKSEIWCNGHRRELPGIVALCIGDAVSVYAGLKSRAPKLLQTLGLEWAFRFLQEPQRFSRGTSASPGGAFVVLWLNSAALARERPAGRAFARPSASPRQVAPSELSASRKVLVPEDAKEAFGHGIPGEALEVWGDQLRCGGVRRSACVHLAIRSRSSRRRSPKRKVELVNPVKSLTGATHEQNRAMDHIIQALERSRELKSSTVRPVTPPATGAKHIPDVVERARAKASAHAAPLQPDAKGPEHPVALKPAAKASEENVPLQGPSLEIALPREVQRKRSVWISDIEVGPRRLEEMRIIAHDPADPRSKAFDLLRTQVLQAMDTNGWRVLAVTSPTPGCGKTVTSLNLALSTARQPGSSVLLVDLDLKKPQIANRLGFECTTGIRAVLESRSELDDAVIRVSAAGIGFGILGCERATSRSSDLAGSSAMAVMLQSLKADQDFKLVILDLPPIFSGAEAMSLLPNVDGVLIVAALGSTTSVELKECERYLGSTPVIRVALNKVREPREQEYC